jgi:hypothetical protein
MSEELGTVIGRGFDTWRRNFSIAIPFILDPLFSMLFVSVVIFMFVFVVGVDEILQLFDRLHLVAGSMSEGQQMQVGEVGALMALFKPYVVPMILAGLVIGVGLGVISTFFKAGAIGMAMVATEKGRTGFSDMVVCAKRHFVNLLLTYVLIGLLLLAGIVFLLPAALSSPALFDVGGVEKNVGLLMLGLFLWMVYTVIVVIALSVVPYALVVESLHPIDAIQAGFKFFASHKLDVILLLILTAALSFGSAVVLGNIPVIGGFLNAVVGIVVIQPLSVVWWTRLYMANTSKKLYVNELLLHPDEMPKTL